MHQSIGLIEIKGLAAAIMVADTMVKVATIQINGLEKTKGAGWITIKIEGNVASVTAAVEAGEQVAREHFITKKVIARPADDVWTTFFPKEEAATIEVEQSDTIAKQQEVAEESELICNLCHDLACTRKKGDPRQNCLHFEEKKVGGENNE